VAKPNGVSLGAHVPDALVLSGEEATTSALVVAHTTNMTILLAMAHLADAAIARASRGSRSARAGLTDVHPRAADERLALVVTNS
jgi:hypothetical protein